MRVLHKRKLSDLDHPGAYLRRTMLNLAKSHNRRMGVFRRKMAVVGGDAPGTADPEYPSDLSQLLELPPTERAALYLAEVEGYQFDEGLHTPTGSR